MIMNEESTWLEPVEVDGLTLYDINREPRRQLYAKDAVVTRHARSINMELTCPICLGILHSTMIVMECLHRFCSECIQKCLRVGRKECPSCRIHVPSRRSLRYDANFDSLIARIYPNLEEYEEHEEKMISDLNKNRNLNNAFTQSCRQGLRNQLQHRRKKSKPSQSKQRRKGDRLQEDADHSGPNKRARNSEDIESDVKSLVNFVLRRHPQEIFVGDLDREYLRTTSDLKVMHMKKFLAQKLNQGTQSNFDIIVVSSEKAVIMDEQLTLKDVCQHFWDGRSDLILHYRFNQG
uniref:RING-type E3 ubiquitin transferase n=1 Tax=Octactis speculum TaxID=3111310 RepID=A0A7S2H2F0_9STRA|mmetsp:Transcript_60654/g.83263  ORF Transcript_60654/g.83263 Transcript_60654/m.83263 type:complete len:292 (+) Transcript_60654:3-878(+)